MKDGLKRILGLAFNVVAWALCILIILKLTFGS